MGKFTMTHDLDCDVDKFWHLFLYENDFNEKLFKELEFPEWKLVEQREERCSHGCFFTHSLMNSALLPQPLR